MKTELIHRLTNNFEAHAQRADNGVEFWLARDIQHLLGHSVQDHFPDVRKMVGLGSGSQRDIDDAMLTHSAYMRSQTVTASIAANDYSSSIVTSQWRGNS